MLKRGLVAVLLAAAFLVVSAAVPAGSPLENYAGDVSVYAQDDDCETGSAGGDTDGCGDHEPNNHTPPSAPSCNWLCKILKFVCTVGFCSYPPPCADTWC